MFEKLQQRLESSHLEVAKTAIPPQVLAILMDVVISLLGGCLKNKPSTDLAQQMKENPVLTRVAVRRALRKQNVVPTNEMIETVVKASSNATASELEAVQELDYVM